MHPWTFSYVPYVPTSKVVGATAGGLVELGKQGILASDDVVRDLNIPVMSNALDLMDDVFWTADQLGIGPEVRAAVYGLREAEYAGVVIGNTFPGAAAATATAASGVLTGIGGMAALGAIGLVAGIVSLLDPFGDDSQEQEDAKQAKVKIKHLRDRLSLEGFAKEQDESASWATLMAKFASVLVLPESAATYAHRAALAQKLAQFYRAVNTTLSESKKTLFESLSNLARWKATASAYSNLKTKDQQAIDKTLGAHLPDQLSAAMKVETAILGKLMKNQPGGGSGGALLISLAVLAAGGAYAAVNPSGALALAKTGLAGARHTASAASAAGRYTWKIGSGLARKIS